MRAMKYLTDVSDELVRRGLMPPEFNPDGSFNQAHIDAWNQAMAEILRSIETDPMRQVVARLAVAAVGRREEDARKIFCGEEDKCD